MKQYWTVFFNHDLYPGKEMSLGIQKQSYIQPSQSNAQIFIKKASTHVATKEEIEKSTQPHGEATEEEIEEPIQPFGAWRNEATKQEIERPNKHFEGIVWPRKTTIKKLEKISQTSITRTFDEKETHILRGYCEKPSAIGEDRHCVTSLESMMNFVISKLGKNIKVMSSSFAQNQTQYIVEEVKKIGDKTVMCHKMNLKTIVFDCHQVNATTIYKVSLMASDGTKSNALTICHHDTRGMNANALYKVLKVRPGIVPICHFIDNKAIAWVPNDSVSEDDDCPCLI